MKDAPPSSAVRNSKQDWFECDSNLAGKPEVMRIRRVAGCGVDVVVGRLVMLWSIVDQYGIAVPENERPLGRADLDGLVPEYGIDDLIDRIGGYRDFWAAVVSTGWLAESPDGLRIPGFESRFSASSKRRADACKRKQRQRIRNAETPCDNNVTDVTKKRDDRTGQDRTVNPPPTSSENQEEEEIRSRLLGVGVTAPDAYAQAIAAAGPEITLQTLRHLDDRRVGGVLPWPPGVIYGRLTQVGRAGLPPDQGWNAEESHEYRAAVESARKKSQQIRKAVERIPIAQLRIRHGPAVDALDWEAERSQMAADCAQWQIATEREVREELMRRLEVKEGANGTTHTS